MLYELRFYKVPHGRVEDNDARHRTHLPPIFARHSINVVGRWAGLAGPDLPSFVYIMAYQDFSEREAQWAGFYGDDEWWQIREETNAGSEMVDQYDIHFLKPNAFWQPKALPSGERIDGVHELIFADIGTGKIAAANEFVKSSWIPAIESGGGKIMMVADFVSGIRLPRIALMIAWPDADSYFSGRPEVDRDPAIRAAQKSEREIFGRTSIGRVETHLLVPARYNLPLATLGLNS